MSKGNRRQWIAAPNRFQSVMFRLILNFLLLLTPIFIMGLTIYQVGISQVDRQISQMLASQMDARISAVERQLMLAQTQMHQLCNENDIQRLAGRPDSMSRYERFSQIVTLQERLQTIHDANPMVQQITVYLPKVDYMVQAVALDTEYTNAWTISKLNEVKFEQTWQISGSQPSKVVLRNGQMLYNSQIPLPTTIGTERIPRIVFSLEYNWSEIHDRFGSLLEGVGTRAALLFDEGQMLGDGVFGGAWTAAKETIQSSSVPKKNLLDLSDADAYIYGVYSEQLGAWCLAYAPRQEAFREMNRFRSFLFVLMALFVLVLLVYGISAYRDIHKPLKLLTGAFDRLGHGDMDFQIQYDKSNEFSYLTNRFNRMLQELKDAMRKLYEQRILMQQAQIRQLQAQINPHFLYNSLFILNNMVEMEDNEAAALMSRSLGEYFRYIARDARETVSLSEELDHAHSYIEVQRIRFGKRLKIEFPERTPETDSVMVPRLTVQPILENAFVHALECSEYGELTVRLLRDEAAFRVVVENTGFAETEERLNQLRESLDDDSPEREITGLINVHRRLKLTFDTGVIFEKVEPDQLRVILTFPTSGKVREDKQ